MSSKEKKSPHFSKGIVFKIHKVVFLLNKKTNKVLNDNLDITLSQFFILMAVDKNPNKAQRRIAQMLKHSPAAVSRQIENLTKEGLIESMIPPFLRNVNLDPDVDLHPFARIHGPMKNPYLVTEYCETLEMGTRKYEIVEVLSVEETKDMKSPSTVSEAQPSFF